MHLLRGGGTYRPFLADPVPEFQSTHPTRGGTPDNPERRRNLIDFNPPTPRGVGLWPGECTHLFITYFNPPTPRGVGHENLIVVRQLPIIISIHPPRVGWDKRMLSSMPSLYDFNPPTPRGVGRSRHISAPSTHYFNPPTPRGVGRRIPWRFRNNRNISIHPPHAGWDRVRRLSGRRAGYFNPPTPRGVGHRPSPRRILTDQFQSTHPAWGGTLASVLSPASAQFQSTHPAWGGTKARLIWLDGIDISIHPPRVGWDSGVSQQLICMIEFQSTHPAWGGTSTAPCTPSPLRFQSTHPAWGGTAPIPTPTATICYFNPPTPRGVGRLPPRGAAGPRKEFQSTHPAWGGTLIPRTGAETMKYFNPPTPRGVGREVTFAININGEISIHPPRVGWDLATRCAKAAAKAISIHPPRVGWDAWWSYGSAPEEAISIHPPRVGWDSVYFAMLPLLSLFQSTHPAWGGTWRSMSCRFWRDISIHPPRVGWDSRSDRQMRVEHCLLLTKRVH